MKKLLSILLALIILVISFTAYADGVPNDVLDASESVLKVTTNEGTGSGFVVGRTDNGSLIVTNYHVVDGAKSISAYIDSQNAIPATVFCYDQSKDLAIIELDGVIDLPSLKIYPGTVERGEYVFAIGYPAAADSLTDSSAAGSDQSTITSGIVSATRTLTLVNGKDAVNLIQIDAAINAGNSGGPLLNSNGDVVGINTFGVDESEGIKGAVSSEELIAFAKENNVNISTTGGFWTIFLIVVLSLVGLAVLAFLCRFIIIKLKNKRQEATVNETIIEPKEAEITKENNCVEECETNEEKKKSKINKKILIPAVCAGVICLFVAYSLITWNIGIDALDNGDFETANTCITICGPYAWIRRSADPELDKYISAGSDLCNNDMDSAIAAYKELGDYRNSIQNLVNASYQKATSIVDSGDLKNGIFYIKDAGCDDDSIEVSNYWAYIAEYYLNTDSFYSCNEYIDKIKDTNLANTMKAKLAEQAYSSGLEAFDNGEYELAKNCFDYCSGSEENLRYYKLASTVLAIDVNSGMATYELTIEGFDISDVYELFDIQEIVEKVNNSALIENYLLGYWSSSDGHYFSLTKDDSTRIPTHSTSYNLPHYNVSGSFEFNNGVYSVGNQDQFAFTIIDQNTVNVYCYYSGQTFTMYRS